MPKSSWRDKYKNKNGKAIQSPRELFKKWFAGKKLLADKIQRKISGGGVTKRGKGGKGRGKGKENRQEAAEAGGVGRGVGRGAGRGVGRGVGRGLLSRGVGRGVGRGGVLAAGGEAGDAEELPLRESAADFAVSGSLVERLIAVKQRLMGGDAPQQSEPTPETNYPSAEGKTKDKGKNARKERPAATVPVVREELVAMNRKLAERGQVKDLKGVHEVLAQLEERGWANPHTYAAAVHALCRCGDWKEAEAALARAEVKRLFRLGSGVSSGVITRTSMLRGYCEVARDISKARALFNRMEREATKAARPNTRTANTFLRGCLQLGAVMDARAVLSRMDMQPSEANEDKSEGKGNEETKGGREDKSVGAPDASSYEMVVSLLCQALRFDEAIALAKRATKLLGLTPGAAGMFVAAARAAAVRGDLSAAAASAKRASHFLEKESGQSGKPGSASDGSGGKRGMGKSEDDARLKSLEVFQTHKRTEVKGDLNEVLQFIEKGSKADLAVLWSRTLIFEDLGVDSAPVTGSTPLAKKRRRQALEHKMAKEGRAGGHCRRLSQAFGLPVEGNEAEAVKRVLNSAFLQSGGHRKGRPWRHKAKAKAKGKAEGKRLDPRKLFAVDRPLRLEVCSGGGEWLCAQALRDKSANWFACELRFDRGTRCFQRVALNGLATSDGNAGLIVGDAHDALQNHLAPASCAHLYVNHPEPPHQSDFEAIRAAANSPGGAEQPSPHLLTVPFLRDACGSVLQPGGTLTICTDSVDYGHFLLESVASKALAGVYSDALAGTPAAKVRRLAQEGEFGLRAEAPPLQVCGAEYKGADGASYFQRLKQSEQRSRGEADEDRFFICLRRKTT